MKKIVLKTTAILLLAAGGFSSCGKDNNSVGAKEAIEAKGTIEGYHKCTDFENGGIVFGVCIVTDKKDTLLSYNIPQKSLCSILGFTSLEYLEQGSLYFNKDIPPVIFDYKEAEEHEIVTIFCFQLALWAVFPGDNAKQIIINKINQEEIK